jgi:hypothetical protein
MTGQIYERPGNAGMRVLYGDGNSEGLTDQPQILHAGSREAALQRAVALEAAVEPASCKTGDREGRLQPRVTSALASPFISYFS